MKPRWMGYAGLMTLVRGARATFWRRNLKEICERIILKCVFREKGL
jgi:hypothetical protein